jgi:arginine N-succinyltransferase
VAATDLDIGERAILATGHLASFRACSGMREIIGDSALAIDEHAARALGVGPGDEVWSITR